MSEQKWGAGATSCGISPLQRKQLSISYFTELLVYLYGPTDMDREEAQLD
jgi:hypothetical protein